MDLQINSVTYEAHVAKCGCKVVGAASADEKSVVAFVHSKSQCVDLMKSSIMRVCPPWVELKAPGYKTPVLLCHNLASPPAQR